MSRIKNKAPLLPLGALAAGFGLASAAIAQTAPVEPAKTEATLPVVRAKASAERPGKDDYQATDTRIGKGKQELRDIPQSVTVLTEKLIDDRNLDDFRDILRATAGITFLAGETGEEDIRLRGFSLGQAGDIYVDGMRDSSIYERDSFNNDRVEVLKGSASMLFGRGSTGGVVNQVNKQALLMNQHNVEATIGSGDELRFSGDFNIKTGDSSALRLNAVVHDADNYGAKVRKHGIAPTFRWGIGEADEFSVSFYHLEFDNVPNYNHPWFVVGGKVQPTVDAKNYYGLASDFNRGLATYGTLTHTHRFQDGGELRTSLRQGRYERSLWASVIRFGTTNGVATTPANLGDATIITRAPKGREGISNNTYLQSDYSNQFGWFGLRHDLITGLDVVDEQAKRNNNFAGPASNLNSFVGTPNDGASRPDTRAPVAFNTFDARSIGVYAQNTVHVTNTLKLIGGLRFDHFKGDYRNTGGLDFSRSDSLWSPRLGALFQPNEWSSYYASFGTSYNTSGDAYQFANARVAATPPEKSRNIEVGGKFDLFEGKLGVGAALFRSEKYNERNTDPDTAAAQELLSGKRHASGFDLNVAGRITPAWEAFVSYTWIASAKIDKSNQALASNGGGAQVQGDRPALTPKHSASLWTTYRVSPKIRVGGGLNYRGEQQPEGSRAVTADSFTTLDLMGEYTVNDKVSLKLNVNNATDKLYVDSLYRGFYAPGAARSVQLTLQAKY